MQEYLSNKTIEKLKYDLVRTSLISFDELSKAEEESKQNNLNLAQVLIQEKYVSEDALLKFIEENLHIPYVNLEDYSLDESCLDFVSPEEANKYRIIPLFRIEDVLTIAMADPLDLFVINDLIKSVQLKIEPVICSERKILSAIEKYYDDQNTAQKTYDHVDEPIIDWREELNEDTPDTLQAEKIINAIISQAIIESSFEIVFENVKEGLNVKFAKERKIIDKGTIPILLIPLFVSRLKSMSNIDQSITETPQLGKFTFAEDVAGITGIVSTFPFTNGERIVIKLYKPPSVVDKLQIKNEEKVVLLSALEKSGLIFILGASGGGKSYIAYSLLNSISSANKNIVTVESISKYNLSGVNQCELNEKVGFDFDKVLKFLDFQSPDVVYIDEVSSDRQLSRVLELAGVNKLVIMEFSAADLQDLLKLFDTKTIEEIEKRLNCIITVENLNEIQVRSSLLNNSTPKKV